MFVKHVSDLTYQDIEHLVKDREEPEGYHLDYKQSLGDIKKANILLAKYISSFANSAGGYLIIGISDRLEIIGINKMVKNTSIDEWINQIVISNVEPHAFYYDPKIIDIPNSDKVLVVIHIPESTKKPHIVSGISNYFIRVNDSSKKANHYQIRDMFEFSRNRTAQFEKFLSKKNLLDEDDPNFGMNKNSRSLVSKIPDLTPKPVILFSMIPQYTNEEKSIPSIKEFKNWLDKNNYGIEGSGSIYCTSNTSELKLDGIFLKCANSGLMSSYFDISNNGYVEAGFSSSFTQKTHNRITDEHTVSLQLRSIIYYEIYLLNWIKRFYKMINSYDDVLFQVSFINVQGFKLDDFGVNIGSSARKINNKHHNNFKLNFAFNPTSIKESQILAIAKKHSEQICRVFGLEQDYALYDKEYDSVHISL